MYDDIYDKINFRRVFEVEGFSNKYPFATSGFCGPYTYVVWADPAAVFHEVWKKEQSSETNPQLKTYRTDKIFELSDFCPIVMPLCSNFGEDLKVYDFAVVTKAAEKGILSLPFLVSEEKSAENFAKKFGWSGEIKKAGDYNIDVASARDLPADKLYTTSMQMNEILASINGHIISMDTSRAFESASSDTDFYRPFPKCREIAEILIARGSRFIDVDRYWDGQSMYAGLLRELNKGNFVQLSSMDLIDRFDILFKQKKIRENVFHIKGQVVISHEGPEVTPLQSIGSSINGSTEASNLAASLLPKDAYEFLRYIPPKMGLALKPPDFPLV